MVVSVYSVDDERVAIPEHEYLLAFSKRPEGFDGLEVVIATYNPKTYVRWYRINGSPVLNVVYWARPNDMLALIHGLPR
jgi:hypothetical protein